MVAARAVHNEFSPLQAKVNVCPPIGTDQRSGQSLPESLAAVISHLRFTPYS